MTGYGSANRSWDAGNDFSRVDVEIRSVNARFLEVKIRQPFSGRIEHDLRGAVEAKLGRGRVDLGVFIRRPGSETPTDRGLERFGVEPERVREVCRAIAEIGAIGVQEKLELTQPNSLEVLRFLSSSGKPPS